MSNHSSDQRFMEAVARTLESEGVFSDHAADRGGATKFGITNRVALKHNLVVRDLTKDQAIDIYWKDYWVAPEIFRVADRAFALELFDTAVNVGPAKAVEIAQLALRFFGLYDGKVDGDLGPKTLAALDRASKEYRRQFILALNGFQFMHYYNIADRDPEQRRAFFRGWMLRLEPIFVPRGTP